MRQAGDTDGGAAGVATDTRRAGSQATPAYPDEPRPGFTEIARAISPRTCSAVYVLVALVVVFGVLAGERFLNGSTVLVILNGSAVSGIVAVALVIPMAAGVFDISVGYVVALSGTLVAYLVAHLDLSGWQAIVLTLVGGAAFALVNVVVVVVMRVHSLIATLATGAIFLSITTALSSQQSITKNVEHVSRLLNVSFLNLSLPVWVLFGLTIIIWFVMRRTPFGRYCYAVGYAPEAARLAGLPVRTLKALALVSSAAAASIGGILLTARLGAGTPTAGPDYLLPAFAAVFVGMTQFERGRFNAPGTFVATLLLATASNGLSVLGAPLWAPQLLQGVILIAAVAANVAQGSFRGSIRRLLPAKRSSARQSQPRQEG